MNLNGQSILITGASDGIGAAMARVLAKRGAKLTLMARSADKLAAVASETGAQASPGDVTSDADRRRAVATAVDRFGSVDVLINNAGAGMYVPAWRADMRQVRELYELNVMAPLELIQLVTPHMQRKRHGMIVNVASIAGKVALPWFTNYTSSKFAVCAMTDTIRMELKPWDIRCMTLCPGYVKTGFQDNSFAGRPPDKLWRLKQFAITADQCAAACVRGMERDARTVFVPRTGWLLQFGYVLIPGIIDHFLGRIYDNLGLDAGAAK
ncbi:MAG: SDR family NAD(P)-dependent oxidoreductase [Bryobacteraceae bacterium]